MAVRVKMRVDTSGPFFTRDPKATFRANLRSLLAGLAEQGEGLVREAYPVFTGAGQAGVKGRITSESGKPWALTAIVSQTHVYPWPGRQGKEEYRGGKVGAPLFRRATSAMRVAARDLAAGLN